MERVGGVRRWSSNCRQGQEGQAEREAKAEGVNEKEILSLVFFKRKKIYISEKKKYSFPSKKKVSCVFH